MQNNRNRKPPRKDNFSKRPETLQYILPSSEILEKFEDAVPGSVADLITMAEKEQNHRHSWQDKYLKSHNFNTRLGYICGLLYNIALLAIVYKLIRVEEKDLAMQLFYINAGTMIFIALLTTFERRVFSRRPRSRGRDDRKRSDKKDFKHPKN